LNNDAPNKVRVRPDRVRDARHDQLPRRRDASSTYQDTGGSAITLSGQITSVLDTPFDLDE
jgi:hypothetical protein